MQNKNRTGCVGLKNSECFRGAFGLPLDTFVPFFFFFFFPLFFAFPVWSKTLNRDKVLHMVSSLALVLFSPTG